MRRAKNHLIMTRGEVRFRVRAGLLAALIIMPGTVAYASESLDTKDDFRGVKCGAKPSADMINPVSTKNPDIKAYHRRVDDQKFGSIQGLNVAYAFWRGEFLYGGIAIETESAAEAIRTLTALYGSPTSATGPEWRGRNVSIQLMRIKIDPYNEVAEVRVTCLQTQTKVDAGAQKSRREQAEGDL